jgi:catechol 2,3-dioxygenase-like lactoylglutathione lyase family enzyme
MVADRGLSQPQRPGQVAHAGLGAGPGRDQAEELKPGGIRQDLDRLCQAFRVSPGKGSVEQPGAATRRKGLDRIHGDILTSVDGSVKISTVVDTKGQPMSRVQLAINVSDLERAVEFYGKLFGAEPAKRRPGYANFAVADPPLKLVLIQGEGQGGSLNHLGVEVFSTDEVASETKRLAGEGLDTRTEEQVSCCYAVQNKVWVTDPDGSPWEVYMVLADAPNLAACC